MIKPTVGRVVLVRRSTGHQEPTEKHPTVQPEVGLITYVHDDVTVGVVGFDRHGDKFAYTHMPLFQGEGEPPGIAYAEWMPYQKGQAAKTEELERTVREGFTKP